MPEFEKKLHRGTMLAEIEDADSELACLRDQAIGMAERLEEIAGSLRRNARLEPSPSDFMAEGDIDNRLTPDQIAKFETPQSVSHVIEELKNARQELVNLRKRSAMVIGPTTF
jgi:hypothetical protein